MLQRLPIIRCWKHRLSTILALRPSSKSIAAWAVAAVFMLAAAPALAQEGLEIAVVPPQLNSGDTAWMLMSCALVMLMTPGLALFYGGMVRKKNVLSSIMHSFAALAVIAIQWVIIGYSLAFGKGTAFIGDWSHFLLLDITPESVTGTIPTYVFMWFQGMFAIITPALISGTIAERIKFSTYVIFILLWATVVYDPIAHWVWGGGWIQNMGALDFAGGTVVHLSSGASALALAHLVGRRQGYPRDVIVPHNMTMTVLGAALLWFGWFGFNAGSALGANSDAGLAFTTTMIAAAAAGLAWMLMEWIFHSRPSALGIASGSVAGLVVVTPAAGFIMPGWSILLGLTAGVLCYYGVRLKHLFGFDDSLDVVGIHGIGGAWGAIATGIFATVGGAGIIAGNPKQVWIQFISVALVALYAYLLTYVLGLILDKVMGFRVSEELEFSGLDKELHGEVGYDF